MSIERTKHILNTLGSAERENRENAADQIQQEFSLFPYLLDIVFQTNYPLSHKAAWVLEILLERDLYTIIDHLETFTSQLHTLKNQSSIRPMSKICLWISEAYAKKQDPIFLERLNSNQVERIIEISFDWLIGEHKVATKSYTMTTLYYLGNLPNKKYTWIHKELRLTILQNIEESKAAYQSKGKKILHILNKKYKQ